MNERYDVVVIGGGSAGLIGAVAGAEGAHVAVAAAAELAGVG